MSRLSRLGVVGLLAAATVRTGKAQSVRAVRSEANAWLVTNADIALTPTFGLVGEAMYERSDFVADPQQIELRLGVQRTLGPSVRVAIGGTFVHNSPYGPFPARAPFHEYRTWVQATVDQRFTKLTLTHRYRLEERWIEHPATSTAASDLAFALRLRYQARVTVPLVSASHAQAPYLALSDEIFLVGGPHASTNLLDQNRVTAALGVRWNGVVRSEAGYMNQVVLRADGRQVENNHTLLVTTSITRPARKHNR